MGTRQITHRSERRQNPIYGMFGGISTAVFRKISGMNGNSGTSHHPQE
jgi:hypothetical protein